MFSVGSFISRFIFRNNFMSLKDELQKAIDSKPEDMLGKNPIFLTEEDKIENTIDWKGDIEQRAWDEHKDECAGCAMCEGD